MTDNNGELERFIKWTQSSNDTWEKIISIMSGNADLGAGEYIRIFMELQEKKFYQILYLLLCSQDNKIECAIENMVRNLPYLQMDEASLIQFTNEVSAAL